jgi:hypothetical protein
VSANGSLLSGLDGQLFACKAEATEAARHHFPGVPHNVVEVGNISAHCSYEDDILSLTPWSKFVIKDVYDKDDFPRDALITLAPTFEYPDYSYLTVGQFLHDMLTMGEST